MLIGGATKRYAQAIFEIARDNTSFDAWQRDLDVMAQLVTDQTGRALFETPNVDNARKWQVASNYLRPRVQPPALNLAHLLIDRGRFAQADRIAATFAELVREHRGIAVADVTTAVPLDQATTDAVGRQLATIIGKQIEMRPQVDPAIIGGVIARVGDYLIDGSVTGRLSQLRSRLTDGR